jgi:hypothetical protein
MRLLLPGFSLVVGLGLFAASGAQPGQDLEQGFEQPPASAQPHTWWHWMNGNISREGLTADLEAMKRVGIGGAQIFNADCDIPHGPIQVLSPEWRQLMRHAFAEADRLGLDICVHNCGGWSSSGGPWVKPEFAMQVVTGRELALHGPTNLSVVLPQPEKRKGFYRDIAVLAFHTPALPDGKKFELDRFKAKVGLERATGLEPDTAKVTPSGIAIPRSEILDLTSKMDSAGKLTWRVPAGD